MPKFLLPKYQKILIKVPLYWVLVVPFVIQTVGAVGLVGYFSYQSGQEVVEDLAKRLLAQVSERVSDRLERYLQSPQQIVDINHLAVKRESLNIQNLEKLEQHFWQQMTLNPLLPFNSFWNEQGEAIGYGRILSEEEKSHASKLTGRNLHLGTNYIMKINQLNPSQRQFYRIDERGKPTTLIYSINDVDFRQLSWYQQAKTARKPNWSSISVNRVMPVLQIQAFAPVYNKAGKFQGVFKSIYFLSDISNFLNKQQFSPSGQVFIIERSGNLVASSSLEKLYVKQATGRPQKLLAINSQDPRTKKVAQTLIKQFGSFDNLQNTRQLNLRINNQKQFIQVTPYRDKYGLDWLIVVIVPESDFMRSVDENIWRTILLCGLTFLGTTVFGIFSTYYITKPIRRLSQASQELATGNWQNLEQEDSAIKEISVLAQSFNRTTQQLQQSFEQIKTALQESEARFTKIFRTCPDPISINQLGDGGKYLEVNDSFLQFSEYSREEVIGKTPDELNLSVPNLQQNAIIWEFLQKHGRIEGFEFVYRTKNGKVGTSLLSLELVELDGQQRVLTIAKDISDRKQLELALQASQEKLNDILNSATAVISSFQVFADWNWEVNYISAGCEFISGYTSLELQTEKNLWVSRVIVEDWEAIEAQIYADIFAERTGTYEYRLYHKDGSLRWISQTNTSRWDAALNCWILTTVSLDITDRKQAQEALRQSEERFQEIARTVNQFFFVRSAITGEYLYISPAYEKIWQRSCESLYQNPDSWLETIHPEDRELVLASIKQQYQKQVKREYRIIRADGEIRWISAEVSLVQDQAGNSLRVVGLSEDITIRKHTEEKLRKTEQWLNQFNHSSPSVIYTLVQEPDGFSWFEYISAACETINEITPQEALKNACLVIGLIHPEDLPGYNAAIIQSAQTLEVFYYQWRITTPSGKQKWLEASSQPEQRSNGAIAWYGVVVDITEHKQTEQALQQALQKINTHFEESPLAILEWNQDFQILRWSKQAERIFGWTAEELKTLSWQGCKTESKIGELGEEEQNSRSPWQFVYEEDLDRVNAEIAPLMNGLITSQAIQNQNYTKDGRVIICQWYSSAVFDSAGNLVSVLSFAQDITEQQKLAAALLESEQTNRALVQSLPDLLVRMTRDGIYLDVRTNEGIKLLNPEKVRVGASIFEVFPPELAQDRLNWIQTTLTTNEVQIQEYQLHIDGEIHYEEARIVPCGINEVLIIVRDVTDRKIIEAALRESEERFRLAFDDAAIGMALVALDGRFLQVNLALCEITGYSEVELIGTFFPDITHPDDLSIDLEYMQQILTGKCRTYQIEKRYIHKSGNLVWGLLAVSVVKDQQGNCLYFVTQIQDISERHKIDRIKNDFISIVSHELRTPLTAIRGALGILETGVLDNRPEKAKYMLQVAVNNSDRLVRLVNDILDLERLESGKVQLVMEMCQIADLMQQAIESVQVLANQALVKMEMTPLVAEVRAAPDAIVQALINLLSNAIKFSPPNSTIWLTAQFNHQKLVSEGETVKVENYQSSPDLASTPYILFQIKDQGRGIPADKLKTVFGKFQQVDISDSRQKGGTGLGLAICKSIVQQHGGEIWAESTLGQGSIFYFTLPITNTEDE
jgi:PAS domain S-box-containing protein